MSVTYLVELSCGHSDRYDARSHPYEGAVLSCVFCGRLRTSVRLSERQEDPS